MEYKTEYNWEIGAFIYKRTPNIPWYVKNHLEATQPTNVICVDFINKRKIND